MNYKSVLAFFGVMCICSSPANAFFYPAVLPSTIAIGTGLSALSENTQADKGEDVFFNSIERLVMENNQNVKGFKETLKSISATDTSKQIKEQINSYDFQNMLLEKQAKEYEASAEQLKQAIETTQDDNMKIVLEAQANAMQMLAQQARTSISVNESIISGLEDSAEDAQQKLDESYESTKRQLDNAANQIVIGAETQYIALNTIDGTISTLERNIKALERSLTVMQKQLELGLASELDVKTMENQLESLKTNLESVMLQKSNLQENLSVTLGNEAGTRVNAMSLPIINDYKLDNIDYNKDLETAMENSYAIWQKQDAARKASNDYEDNITSTVDAYEAAKLDLEATKNQTQTSFKGLYDTLNEKRNLLKQAEKDLVMSKQNFDVARLKYEKGMISQLEYLNEQDKLETAKDAVETAKTDLFTAYNTYQWGVKGVMGGQI